MVGTWEKQAKLKQFFRTNFQNEKKVSGLKDAKTCLGITQVCSRDETFFQGADTLGIIKILGMKAFQIWNGCQLKRLGGDKFQAA